MEKVKQLVKQKSNINYATIYMSRLLSTSVIFKTILRMNKYEKIFRTISTAVDCKLFKGIY